VCQHVPLAVLLLCVALGRSAPTSIYKIDPNEIVPEATRDTNFETLSHQHWETCLLPHPIAPADTCHYPAGCDVTVSCKSKLVENKLYRSSPADNKVTGPTTLGPMCEGACSGVAPGCCLKEVEARANQLYYSENCRGKHDSSRNVEGSQAKETNVPAQTSKGVEPTHTNKAVVEPNGDVSVNPRLVKKSPPAPPPAHQALAPSLKSNKTYTIYFWHDGDCRGEATTVIHDVTVDTCYNLSTSDFRAFKVSEKSHTESNLTYHSYDTYLFHTADATCEGAGDKLSVQSMADTGRVPCVGPVLGTAAAANNGKKQLRMQVDSYPSPGARNSYACTYEGDLGQCESATATVISPSMTLLAMLLSAVFCGTSQ